jgi:outer membrane lipoprotein-sorting protein
MIKKILLSVIGSICLTFVFAQQANDSDPQARKTLENLKKEYDTYSSLEINFDLILDLPDQAPEQQKGKVIQAGEKYKLELDAQAVYCDGKTVWVHLKDNNEVQINDVEETEDDSFLTPTDMLKIYESEDFYYAITDSSSKGKKTFQTIEFKPLEDNSEYSKMRIIVNTTDRKIKIMEIFSKDGSKYKLEVKNFLTNKQFPGQLFVFDANKFPGIHVEDLRF